MEKPQCPYFGKCGGCTTQHVPYAVQLENKKKLLSHAVGTAEVAVVHGDPYGYRNRMEFVFHSSGVGFRERGKWSSIIDIAACSISNARLNHIITQLRAFFSGGVDAFDLQKHSGTFHFAVVRTPGNMACVSFVLNKDSARVGDAVALIEKFARESDVDTVVVTYTAHDTGDAVGADYVVVKGSDLLSDSVLGKKLSFSVQGFFQNNTVVANKMVQHVHDLFKKYDTSGAHLLDLYGGVGTFGVPLASLFKSVTIVENVPSAIECAQRNFTDNGVTNGRAIVLDAKQLKKIEFPSPLMVIVDPPRTGMDVKTIDELKRLSPKVLVYVSCNPDQLRKELPKFKNYTISNVTMFDMFPQTNHVEAIVELVRKN